jgi:TolB-like protein/Tfp pilus assembly protein PilF
MGEERQSFISAVMGELSRRKVLRTVGAYAVGVFVVLQLMDAAVEPLRLPDWLPTLVVVVLILGFPIVFVLAWQFDITGEGIRRTRDDDLLAPGQRFALFSAMLVATGGLAFGFFQYYGGIFTNDTPTSADAADRTFSAPENSIAVLPFADLSETGDQAHLSDGMAEEILNLLAQVEGLHVAARTSSFAFRDRETDIREIGRALNVSTVLEGSLRTSGDRIRLTAQLINVEDGYHIWSETFDRDLGDVFALQDEVASSIAGSLVDSFAGLAEEAPTARPRNLAAFEAYGAGRLHWWRRTPAELEKAIQLFGEALEHDPQYAPAYAAIADSYILMSLYGDMNQLRAVDKALRYIEHALELDPESAEAHAALGLARLEIGQIDSAESALRQAVRMNDNYVPAHLWLANVLGQTGRVGEQKRVLQNAMAIDPLNELLAINYAGNLNSQGEYDEARAIMRDLLLVKPDSTTLLRSFSSLALYNGELVEGWRLARQAYDIDAESPAVVQMLAKAWLELGDLERAEALLQEAMALAPGNMELKSQYLQLLLVDGRLEEAEGMVRDIFGDDPESLPDNFRRFYHQSRGLIRMVAGNLPAALTEFELAIDPEESQTFNSDQLFCLTAASFLHGVVGDPAMAETRLRQADRALDRARLNGIDHPDIYYTQSVVDVLHDDHEAAMQSLQAAYNKGWRQLWILDVDGRLEPLHEMPGFIELKRSMEEDLREARSEIESQSLARR